MPNNSSPHLILLIYSASVYLFTVFNILIYLYIVHSSPGGKSIQLLSLTQVIFDLVDKPIAAAYFVI